MCSSPHSANCYYCWKFLIIHKPSNEGPGHKHEGFWWMETDARTDWPNHRPLWLRSLYCEQSPSGCSHRGLLPTISWEPQLSSKTRTMSLQPKPAFFLFNSSCLWNFHMYENRIFVNATKPHVAVHTHTSIYPDCRSMGSATNLYSLTNTLQVLMHIYVVPTKIFASE